MNHQTPANERSDEHHGCRNHNSDQPVPAGPNLLGFCLVRPFHPAVVPVECQIHQDDLLDEDEECSTDAPDIEVHVQEQRFVGDEAHQQFKEEEQRVLCDPSLPVGGWLARHADCCQDEEQCRTESAAVHSRLPSATVHQYILVVLLTTIQPCVCHVVGYWCIRHCRCHAVLEYEGNGDCYQQQEHRPFAARVRARRFGGWLVVTAA
mmetsp:Transcript_4851/g.12733  ORF Transcript_4851/g.12733 Transcript_4851/m.12733 type:complete len:207 (-) Transcript_4851:412-1032(-)